MCEVVNSSHILLLEIYHKNTIQQNNVARVLCLFDVICKTGIGIDVYNHFRSVGVLSLVKFRIKFLRYYCLLAIKVVKCFSAKSRRTHIGWNEVLANYIVDRT